jgi:hypothetical protein
VTCGCMALPFARATAGVHMHRCRAMRTPCETCRSGAWRRVGDPGRPRHGRSPDDLHRRSKACVPLVRMIVG